MTPRKTTTTPAPEPVEEEAITLPPYIDPETGEYFPIHRLMAMILDDLPAIGKVRENTEQNFKFRGFDDVLEYLNPLLSKYGVFTSPHVLERIREHRVTRSGNANYETSLHVMYTFHGPAGDEMMADAWGEGVDTGDKGTNKAMTNAMKNVLNQVFAIATREVANLDSDNHTPEDTVEAVQCQQCIDSGGPFAVFPAPSVDPEPLREHMVEAHGYTRLEDGRVTKPAQAATTDEEPDVAPAPTEPDDAPQAATEAAETPEESPAPNPSVPEKDVEAFVNGLKGEDLVKQLASLNLKVGGKVGEMRDRLKAHLMGTADAPAAAPEPEPEPEPEPDEPSEPAPEADAANNPDAAAQFQCPDCDVFPFRTEDEYTDHWYATHDDGTGDEATGDDEPEEPVTAEASIIEALREAISGLRGDDARAYGKYRRDNKLPSKIEEMSLDQAMAAFGFIEGLAPAT